MPIRYIIVILLMSGAWNGYAQQFNPFELRIDTAWETQKKNLQKAIEADIDYSNPFEIKYVPENYFLRDTLKVKKPVPITSNKDKNQNFLFVSISLLLLFLTILVVINRSLLSNIYRAILNDTYLKLVYRFQNNSQTLSYGLFYLFFFLNAGLFTLLLLKNYKVELFDSDIKSFFALVGVVMLTYVIKHFVLQLIGSIFPIEKEISYYSFTIIAFNIFLGIALLPINGLIAFTSDHVALLCLYIGIGLALILYCIRQLRGMYLVGNFLAYNKFHFFIYLCTVEIAPILILAKFIISSL